MSDDHIADKLLGYLRQELAQPDLAYGVPLTPLQGGNETHSFSFKLAGAGDDLSQMLVLRLYPAIYGARNAIWESMLQNVLAEEGYPVARAHVVCSDPSILGGAFFIMDYLPGQPLIFASMETMPQLLGKIHAELHDINPEPLIRALQKRGIEESAYRLNNRFDWHVANINKLSSFREIVEWLVGNGPPEPERLSVCHGDFHGLNILVHEGTVTGVLDWPGFKIADPLYDIGTTIVLTSIAAKHLSAAMPEFSGVDWDAVVAGYLAAYRTQRTLDDTHLAYYRVRRCALALIEGVRGQKIWQHPLIVADVVEYIQGVTGTYIEMAG